MHPFVCSPAAARALLADPSLSAEEVVRRSMEIAGDMCVYTNHNLIVENIPADVLAPAATEETEQAVAVVEEEK
jgi:hypothetical protein